MERRHRRGWLWTLIALLSFLGAGAVFLVVQVRVTAPSPGGDAGSEASGSVEAGTTPSAPGKEGTSPPFPCTLKIPALGLELQVREGAREQWKLHLLLREGPVHLPWTPPPGARGNCVISGHRTTYTRPFHRLDELKEGDEILLGSGRGFHVYQVYRVFQVGYWVDVTGYTADAVLTLTTCAPKGSSSRRLVVRASYLGFREAGSDVP
jgi:LPXTG-site transpeptidase (sortase) family protein